MTQTEFGLFTCGRQVWIEVGRRPGRGMFQHLVRYCKMGPRSEREMKPGGHGRVVSTYRVGSRQGSLLEGGVSLKSVR